MCNAKMFAGTEIPVETFDMLQHAMANFKADPSSWEAFEAAEFASTLFSIRMSKYATARRCAAGAKWRPPIAPSAEAPVSASLQPGSHGRDK